MAVSTTSTSLLNGSGSPVSMATSTDPAGLQRAIVSLDEAGAGIYRCSASFVPFGTADRTLISITGSTTKTIRVRRILLQATVATTAANNLWQMARTTALGTGGTAVLPTLAKLDSGTVGAGTAVVTHYTTAAQSVGTGPIILSKFNMYSSILAAPTVPTPWLSVFPEIGGTTPMQSLTLRGTSDFIEIGNVASNFTGTLVQYVIEWSEDGS